MISNAILIGVLLLFFALKSLSGKQSDTRSFNTELTTTDDKRSKEEKFLDEYGFYGLTNLSTGFDAPTIKYFSETDFEIVLKRVEEHQLGILGIEPWYNGQYYSTRTYESETTDPIDANWYMNAFKEFKESKKDLQYSATYLV